MPPPRYPSDLSDAEWSVLEPLLASSEKRGRLPKWHNPPATTALLLLLSAALMVAFAAVERRTKAPLVPTGVFVRSRNLTVSNVVMALAVVGMFG